ncbi:MAG: endonuclease/exonuclease/phosphatase family protein [Planctomycetaceae bacterium]|nr:endonuclease/exonuclease/phosphatase family protein [Planctomycetaceae bacterium]
MDHTIKVMTFNIWRGGVRGGQPLSQSAEVMQHADIIGVQETYDGDTDSSAAIASMLRWHHFDQGGRTSVISRFPITRATPGRWGVFVKPEGADEVCVLNCHLAASPYQPYQLLRIPYGEAPFIRTELEAIAWANRARGRQLDRLLSELTVVKASGTPFVVTGDFNEPSHLDWTQAAAKQGLHPLRVRYPASRRMQAAGATDCYRAVYSDPTDRTGFTWTPTTQPEDPGDHHDRIDFVYCSPQFKVLAAAVAGETETNAQIVVSPWPSDHRAVMASLTWRSGQTPA